jgi:hypothetical protein
VLGPSVPLDVLPGAVSAALIGGAVAPESRWAFARRSAHCVWEGLLGAALLS